MYAIVEIGGHQYKVAENDLIYVDHLANDVDEKVDFDRILLVNDDKKVHVGKPVVEGAQIQATVVDHVKADKLIVFKKKRRKGYQKRTGHRQKLTQIRIDKLTV
ncbi:MAG TPA: 50S ribosomal protein L21 [Balneolales bacterium]|jgi:large subunit ribosomal protein L21|nr:50S ribosomal protein L21 [Balneolales bacterium]